MVFPLFVFQCTGNGVHFDNGTFSGRRIWHAGFTNTTRNGFLVPPLVQEGIILMITHCCQDLTEDSSIGTMVFSTSQISIVWWQCLLHYSTDLKYIMQIRSQHIPRATSTGIVYAALLNWSHQSQHNPHNPHQFINLNQTDNVSRKSKKTPLLFLVIWWNTSAVHTLCIWTHATEAWDIKDLDVLNFNLSTPHRKQHLKNKSC